MTAPIHPSPLSRNADLVVAGIYRRAVEASLERVWENVHDWEHLPWLHHEAFSSIEHLASGDWGWRAQVGLAGGATARIELVTDPEAGRYVARTLEGAGAPGEIWTRLEPVATDRTAIEVEFCVAPLPEATLRRLGEGYIQLYTRLWDQDEGMMQTRATALEAHRDSRQPRPEIPPLDLGSPEEVRARLPLVFELGGVVHRVVAIGDELVAHATECPHLFGPLDRCEVEGDEIVCPWHGYRFDVRTGRSREGRSLRLRRAPRLELDAATGHLIAHARSPERQA